MYRLFTLIFFMIVFSAANAQITQDLSKWEPEEAYENVYVQKIAGDSNSTSFVIWIKKEVKEHYHATHSEVVYVMAGTGTMTLGNSSFSIKVGQYIFIPKNTAHSVQVTSKEPLKVISIQAPLFDGSDRVFGKPASNR